MVLLQLLGMYGIVTVVRNVLFKLFKRVMHEG